MDISHGLCTDTCFRKPYRESSPLSRTNQPWCSGLFRLLLLDPWCSLVEEHNWTDDGWPPYIPPEPTATPTPSWRRIALARPGYTEPLSPYRRLAAASCYPCQPWPWLPSPLRAASPYLRQMCIWLLTFWRVGFWTCPHLNCSWYGCGRPTPCLLFIQPPAPLDRIFAQRALSTPTPSGYSQHTPYLSLCILPVASETGSSLGWRCPLRQPGPPPPL